MSLAKARRLRIPKLRFTNLRDIGWYVAYRDRTTNKARRHRFGIPERTREREARVLYHAWVTEHLGGPPSAARPTRAKARAKQGPPADVLSGSVLDIASGLIDAERARARTDDQPRSRGTIAAAVFRDRTKQIRDFLTFLNEQHGDRAVARLRIADLSMEDIETYNRLIVDKGFSASQVAKRMQLVKTIIDRGGRPEYGRQLLTWNWASRDVAHGLPPRERILPTVSQLKHLLAQADLRGQTMIWLGLGMGLGAKDLAVIHTGQITKDAYDLRRAKTGVERYGPTPPVRLGTRVEVPGRREASFRATPLRHTKRRAARSIFVERRNPVVGYRTAFGARHVEQALLRLKPGGRLVAIVGRGMASERPTFRKWWAEIEQRYRVRANLGIDGSAYTKFGTTFDNQIIVIDRDGPIFTALTPTHRRVH